MRTLLRSAFVLFVAFCATSPILRAAGSEAITRDPGTFVERDYKTIGIPHYRSSITDLTGGSANDLDAVPTASSALLPGVVFKFTISGAEQTWVLTSATTAEDGVTYVRPDDYNASTNTRVWVNITPAGGGGGGGDITEVIAGAGLTDGGTTGSVTINIGAGTGITVNANDIAIDDSVVATDAQVSSAIAALSTVYQPLEPTLTDIADGTIAENLVNTTNPWADDEVSDTITVGASGSVADAAIASTIARDSETTAAIAAHAALLVAVNASGVNTDGLVEWSQLVGVPAGFADGSDDGSGGSSGTTNTIKENGSQVGDSDIVTLDFLGADFDLTESPNQEVNIVIAAALTRDTEWDTAAEINTATTDDDFATLTGSQTLTNKTLTSAILTTPRLADLGFIADANGNELLIGDTVTSAVNEVTLANAATGANPQFSATGGDTDVGLNFLPKAAGKFRFLATTSGPAELRLFEDADNGTNYAGIIAPSTLGSDITITLPSATGTLATLAGTETFTNKTLTSPTLTTPALGMATATSVQVGSAQINSSPLSVDGGSDVVQFSIQAHSTQTANVMEIEQSDGTVVFSVTNAGAINAASATATTVAAGSLEFEGATADAFETTIAVVDPTADRVITLPDATTTMVGTDVTQTLTNKTLTSPVLTTPRLADLGFIADANGNELLIGDTVTSAVNEVTLANAATGANPQFSATGGDTDVGLNFAVKAAGKFRFLATTSGPAELRLFEDADNGTNYAGIIAPSTLASDITLTLPSSTGTLARTADITGTNSGTNTGDQNIFSTFAVSGQSDVVADTTGDTVTLAAGSNITITTNATTDTITIAASGSTGYATVQEEGSGLTQRATLNFVGGGFTAADDAGNSRTNVTLDSDLNTWAGVTPGTGVATALAATANATGGVVTVDGTATLTNKTLTAPRLADLGFIADANGNELLIGDTVTSAVNEVTLANAATGANPQFSATGGDTDVGLNFLPKGAGKVRFLATASGPAELRLFEDSDNGTNYAGIIAPSTLGSDITITLPSATGTLATLAGTETFSNKTLDSTVVASTPSAGDNDTSPATSAFVNTQTRGSNTGTHASPSTSNPLALSFDAIRHTVWYGATGEIDLPAAASYTGRGFTVYNTGAFTITFDPNASEVIVRDGNVQTGGVSMTLSSGAGNFVSFISDGARWITLGYKGALAVGS